MTERRAVLRSLCGLAGLALAAPALAAPAARTTLSVAYIPIMPMAQLFVIEGEGWAKAAGLDLALTRFSSGPAMLQAIASGRYDIMYIGIGPAMIARANGVPLKVVASNVADQVTLLVRGDLAKAAAGGSNPADAIRQFTATAHRKPKIATLPKGSVPDLALRYWLDHNGLGEPSIDIVGMGAGKVQEALITRSVDGASIVEPIVTIIEAHMPDARVLLRGGQLFPDLPGAVLAVRESALQTKHDAVERLIALHIRATSFLRQHPDAAAKDLDKFIGRGLIPLPLMERAVRSPSNKFISDPRKVIGAANKLQQFSRRIGTLRKPLDIGRLFDLAAYTQATKRRQ